MSVSAMKCALQSLESVGKVKGWNRDSIIGRHCTQSAHFLRQAIAEAEDAVAAEREACANVCEDLIGTRAMARHCADAIRARGDASDIPQEPVDKTAKNRHISYVCPNCHWSLNRQEPDDDIYDIWVEQGTCQENRQVAKNATTERGQVRTKSGPSQDQVGTRIWVGLTDEEVEAIYDQEDHVDLVLLTEAKLKEKNVPQP